MAQVDFSNAKLDVASVDHRPLTYDKLLQLEYEEGFLNSSKQVITNNSQRTVLYSTINKRTLVYTGVFTASGTEFYIGSAYYINYPWRVSNISFSAGDTYSFAIDVEVSIV